MNRLNIQCIMSLFVVAAIGFVAGCQQEQAHRVGPGQQTSPSANYHEASYTAVCGGTKDTVATRGTQNIVETAAAAGEFETLLQAAREAGLAETLANEGPWTLFAPTDRAFAQLPAGALENLLADRQRLTEVLLYHVVPGRVTSDQITGQIHARTAQGSMLEVRPAHGTVAVGQNAEVITADLHASNGVIHVIDTVLMPPR
jgi:uncharacterized surface protein with fasciclin (FAS1) repeats